jgi:hypothetical protein
MSSAQKSQDSVVRPHLLPTTRPATGVAWPLLKAIVLWFLLGLGASRLAMSLGTSPFPFALFFTLALVLHVATVWLRAALVDGVSVKLRVTVIACFFVCIAMFTTLRQTDHGVVDAIIEAFGLMGQSADRASVAVDETFRRMRPADHLTAANNLIFGKETQKATLDEARLHLGSIPPGTTEYRSAQALLQVVENRQNELEAQNGNEPAKVPIQIIASERAGDHLRVTFRNVGTKTVRRIRYSVSYFRVADGWHVEPDKQSEIVSTMRPGEKRTIDISDEVLTGRDFNASFSISGWEVVPGSQR